MILIDTNIISEMMKSSPANCVKVWLDKQNVLELFVSTITLGEISYGLHKLTEGKRRSLLENAFDGVINEAFKHRVLSFDDNSAYTYGKIMAYKKKLGRPMTVPDGQIAAIAKVHNLAVATRNICDFENCGIEIINPFEN